MEENGVEKGRVGKKMRDLWHMGKFLRENVAYGSGAVDKSQL